MNSTHLGTTPVLPIYLDYAATTPVDPRVAEKMLPYLTGEYGNPASRTHSFGWEGEKAVDKAREQVSALVNCDPGEVIWTSGATESNNLAIKGAARFYASRGRHLCERFNVNLWKAPSCSEYDDCLLCFDSEDADFLPLGTRAGGIPGWCAITK